MRRSSPARAAFAEPGYDRASIRGIAAEAGVDLALVCHYFGTKDELFAAALELPLAPRAIFERAVGAGPDQLGATLVRAFLEAWEPPETRVRLIAMLRSAMTSEAAMGMIRDLLTREVFGPITEALGVPDAQPRATLVGSQFVGLAIMRYIGHLEPLASPSIDELVAAVGPAVQRYLTGGDRRVRLSFPHSLSSTIEMGRGAIQLPAPARICRVMSPQRFYFRLILTKYFVPSLSVIVSRQVPVLSDFVARLKMYRLSTAS